MIGLCQCERHGGGGHPTVSVSPRFAGHSERGELIPRTQPDKRPSFVSRCLWAGRLSFLTLPGPSPVSATAAGRRLLVVVAVLAGETLSWGGPPSPSLRYRSLDRVPSPCVCVSVCACVRACVRARARVRACVRACVYMHTHAHCPILCPTPPANCDPVRKSRDRLPSPGMHTVPNSVPQGLRSRLD